MSSSKIAIRAHEDDHPHEEFGCVKAETKSSTVVTGRFQQHQLHMLAREPGAFNSQGTVRSPPARGAVRFASSGANDLQQMMIK